VGSRQDVDRFLRQRRASAWRGGPESPKAALSHGRWKLGAQVRHPKFGLGTVLSCEGEGEDAKLTVSFPGYGRKKFVEKYAGLEKA
jgi:DNA helicase-2/ATP-dependent DNA helicase PcrA